MMKASTLIKLWIMITAFWGVFIFGYSIGKDGSLSSYYLFFWLMTSFTIFIICWLTILLMRVVGDKPAPEIVWVGKRGKVS
ncbi:MAG: hypothetical protein VW729_18665 [Deltaproteobacteria bacterium]